jgi:phage gpG-like protein
MAQIDVTVEDNSQKIKEELNKAVQMVLFAWGTEGVAGCVDKASEIDDATGRPTVDTGRYRAGFGFITPTQGAMSGTPADVKGANDNFSGQRATENTVIIANNVEYAPYLEFGTGTQKGGHHARHIMKRGIESKLETMRRDMEQILKGKGTMSVSGI